jgi:uncharacterized Zn finger protein
VNFWSYGDYVPVAEKRAKAEREVARLRKTGRAVSPVVTEGRRIARTFWGKAWCDNLERYADFENRLPRGRSYVWNGLVIDLAISRGKVEALVYGSEIYNVTIEIALPSATRWQSICKDCAGSVGSLVELLQGKFSTHVMQRVCRKADGLFPAPAEMKLSCSCYDWAELCKHKAAALYGVGARLDADPDILFTLRGVNRDELLSNAGGDLDLARAPSNAERVLEDADMAALFGIDMAETPILPPVRLKPAAKAVQPAEPARRPKAKPGANAGKRGMPARAITPRAKTSQKASAPAAPAGKATKASPASAAKAGARTIAKNTPSRPVAQPKPASRTAKHRK